MNEIINMGEFKLLSSTKRGQEWLEGQDLEWTRGIQDEKAGLLILFYLNISTQLIH